MNLKPSQKKCITICIVMVVISLILYKTIVDPSTLSMTDVKDASLAIFTGIALSTALTFAQIIQTGRVDIEKLTLNIIVLVSIAIVLIVLYLVVPTLVAEFLGVSMNS